ncbi:hypothetical protein ACOYW6_11960 [Parablastomonas sp. CN1-191]|uniref:hypothetical protein n=1 Tax=Parablastomonas sp. CN1-191 TaxID=3400908 RepID=UPI003BF7D182
MRKFVLALVPALALVAACKGGNTAPDAAASEAATATPGATVAAAMPTVPADARSVVFVGTYSHAGANGNPETLELKLDDTYAWTDAAGKTITGKYAWYSDHRRILLTGAANNAVFAVADGGLYKMAGKDAPIGTFTADQLWTRNPGA